MRSTFKLIILLTVLNLSCKKNQNNLSIKKANIDEQIDIVRIENIPDTVFVNKVYFGKIEYKSQLDTIEISKGDIRHVVMFTTTQNGYFKDIESIEKVKHDIFAINKSSFIEFAFSFENVGPNNFNAIIEDMVMLDNYYGVEKSRIITRLTEIQKEIFVIDSTDLN